MTDLVKEVAERRARLLRQRLRRNKLVFVQCGFAFNVIREPLIAGLNGQQMTASSFARTDGWSPEEEQLGPLVLTELEVFASDGEAEGLTLGQLRQRVDDALDKGTEVCLLSAAPRIAYAPVAGSSLIEDASVFCIPLLDEAERETSNQTIRGSALPALGLGVNVNLQEVFGDCLRDLGVNVLAALDYALFESENRNDFLSLLEPRELEAMRGAGLVQSGLDSMQFIVPDRMSEFTSATADVLADIVTPQSDLGEIAGGLWFIERTIRRVLRAAAIQQHGARWRRSVLAGTLSAKAVERARADAYVTAENVSALRDPIEWLSLGELLEVVRSNAYNGLAFDDISWRRFSQDIVPIRNRLSHMRLVKKGDKETVAMWVSRVRKKFG